MKIPADQDDEILSEIGYGARGVLAWIHAHIGIENLFEKPGILDIDELMEYSHGDGWHTTKSMLDELVQKDLIPSLQKKCFVYLMRSVNTGFYKIGITTGYCVRPRLKAINNGDPSVILVAKSDASPQVERELHQKFKDKCVGLEWFKLTPQDIAEILKIGDWKAYVMALDDTIIAAKHS